jgi:hypothetical protein
MTGRRRPSRPARRRFARASLIGRLQKKRKKIMMPRRLMSFLFVAALAVLPATPVTGQSLYTFTRIADTSNFPDGILAPVALNDDGLVAFVALRPGGVTGVFIGRGGAITTVADTSRTFTFFGLPGINGRGQATFFANKGDHLGGYYAGLDGVTTIVENRGAVLGSGGDIFSSPSGTFSTVNIVPRLPRQPQVIIVGDGGRAIRIADTSGLFQGLDLDPRVNASGRVAFHAMRRDFSDGIFVGRGGAVTIIADTSGPFASFKDSPAINDRGDVLFQAGVNAPDGSLIAGLFLSRHGEIRTVLDSTGAFGDFGGAPGLNARGQVAFQGTANPNPNVPDATRLTGIFTGGDPVADRVLAVGDAIDGSTVSSFDRLSFASSLNNGGQIAFLVSLADGRTGVYRADPVQGGHDGQGDR